MAKNGKVDWYGDEVALVLENATKRGLEALAAVIDGDTKINIVENDQVDTGFMVNSVYHAGESNSTYAEASKTGDYANREGDMVARELAPEAPLPASAGALICVGARYAIYQEMQQPFLYPALLSGAQKSGGVIEATAKAEGLHA